MARLFAIADLHLSASGAKPMHVFGELWRDHARRIAQAWDATVSAEDTVLLAGDLSWARKLDEARPDLAWIGERPGRKLLLKGNHDSWWSGLSRVRAAMPPGCEVLRNDSHEVGEWIVIGARGWVSPDDPAAGPGDERIFRRELARLESSVRHADARHGPDRPRLAMLHFPPWIAGSRPTPVVDILRAAGVRVCVYGHLHGADHRLAVRGKRGGIVFYFVAADAIGFAPVEIPPVGSPAREGGGR